MGKTTMPLRVLVHPNLVNEELFEGLELKGHTIDTTPLDGLTSYDIVVGPNCWRLASLDEKSMEMVMKAARAAKKEQKNG